MTKSKAPALPDDDAPVTKKQPKKLPKPPTIPKGVKGNTPIQAKKERKIKTFEIVTWSGENDGEKILGYADSGLGKTTCAAMAPTPVFMGLDDGGRKIKHPVTGEDLKHIPGIENFSDFRDALHQHNLFNDYETVVVDTGTILEHMAHDWMLENITNDAGNYVVNIEKYGWGKGHRHLYDTMRLPLLDMEALVRKGKNIIILCQMQQAEMTNTSGENYLCDVPKLALQHGKTPAIWSMYNEWCDHVFKIGYSDLKAKDKKATASNERIIFLDGTVTHKAKSRTVPSEFSLITFSTPDDDSVWRFIFDDAWKDLQEEK